MNPTTYVILVDLPFLTLGLGVICAIAWNRNGGAVSVLGNGRPLGMKLVGIAGILGLWLLLTLASLWFAFFGGLMVVYFLLFSLGRAAAALGAILLGIVVASIPFLWGWALLRLGVR